MSTQHKVKHISIESMFKNKYFQLGFRSSRMKEPWPKEYDSMSPKQQWDFEAGRAFGVIAPREILVIHREVSERAVAKYIEALENKWIL